MTHITQQEIIEIAKEAGFMITENGTIFRSADTSCNKLLTKFAQLIEARLAAHSAPEATQTDAVREALEEAAKICDDRQSEPVATVYYSEQYGIKILPTTKAMQQLKPNDKLYLAAPQQAIPADEAVLVCAEAYVIVGALFDKLGMFDTDISNKILDNLSQAKLVHKDILPFIVPTRAEDKK